ncbi:MAG TPA: hydrolase TatD [Clostridiales bacterium]|nr:hydrolase TatD [Clostridiales bacterium]
MIIDTHTHLSDPRYLNVAETLSAFKAFGGEFIIDVGFDKDSSLKAAELARSFNDVYFAAGYHPSEEAKNNDYEVIDGLLSDEKCVAVGEIGLDYHYAGYDKARQRELFERQILLAHKNGLPFIVHSRDASADMLETLSDNKKYLGKGFLMHCYSESKEQAMRYLDLGAYFAFGGAITFKNAKKDEVIKALPIDRIMAETDCPYMAPEPFRGTLNEPKNVIYVYRKLSEILDFDIEELSDIIRDNVKRLFTKLP